MGVSRQFRSAPYDSRRRREVMCISRLVKQKNLTSLLHAWASVHERDKSALLRIVGEGPERQYLIYLAQSLGIENSVRFEGRVSDVRKWELLDQAMLFVHPSLQEGFGIVLLEAMLAGLPIVAYDLPVFRQFVSHGLHGLFAPLADHERLAECILALLNDEELRTEISRANTEYVGEFEWEQAADREEEILRAIVSGRRASVER
ncbi:MAG: glycosyltransferase [Chloroflexia bacterium]